MFYKQIVADESAEDVALYFKENNDEGDSRLYLLTCTSASCNCDVTYKGTPLLHEPKAKNNTATVIIIVVVILLVIVLGFVGFYVWLQIKRNGSRNGSRQLKNTAKV